MSTQEITYKILSEDEAREQVRNELQESLNQLTDEDKQFISDKFDDEGIMYAFKLYEGDEDHNKKMTDRLVEIGLAHFTSSIGWIIPNYQTIKINNSYIKQIIMKTTAKKRPMSKNTDAQLKKIIEDKNTSAADRAVAKSTLKKREEKRAAKPKVEIGEPVTIKSTIKKAAPKKAAPKPKAEAKKPGVIATIASLITKEPQTLLDILDQLVKKFPDRDAKALSGTINAQLGGKKDKCRLEREKGLSFKKTWEGKTKLISLK